MTAALSNMIAAVSLPELLISHFLDFDIAVGRFKRNLVAAAVQLVDRVDLFFIFINGLRFLFKIRMNIIILTTMQQSMPPSIAKLDCGIDGCLGVSRD